MLTVSHVVFFIALACSFIYGVAHSFKRRGVLFLQIVTCAAGSMMLGELFYLLVLLSFRSVGTGFNISMLGTFGSYFFLLSASYGQIDGLGDDRSRDLRKYRLIPLVLPAAYLVLCAVDWMSDAYFSTRVINLILVVPLLFGSYFNLKHLIIPDVELGILTAMRKYNLLVIIINTLSIVRVLLIDYDFEFASCIVMLFMAAGYLLLLPVATKGVKQWFI